MTPPETPEGVPPPVAPFPPLELEFALSESEFVHANMIVIRPRLRRTLLIYAGLAALYSLMIGAGTVPAEYLVWVLPLGPVVNAALLIPQTRSRLRQRFRSSDNEQALVRVTLSPEGYRNESPFQELRVRWPAFSHYVETRTAILLYLGPGNAFVLPRSCLAEAQLQEVLRLLRENIGRTRFEPPVRGFAVTSRV